MKPSSGSTASYQRWFTRVYLSACLLGLVFLLRATPLPDIAWQASALGTAVVLLMAVHLEAGLFLWAMAHWEGVPLSLGHAYRIHLNALPARYLPGGIWHTVGRLLALQERGYSSAAIARFPLMESAAALLAAGLLAMLVEQFADTNFMYHIGLLTLALSMANVAAFTWIAQHRANTSQASIVAMAGMAMLGLWSLLLTAFALYTQMLPELHALVPRIITSTYLWAWCVGHLAIFAPQGLGVTEAVFSARLGSGLDFVIPVAGFRVLTLLADALCYLVFLIVAGVLNRRAAPEL